MPDLTPGIQLICGGFIFSVLLLTGFYNSEFYSIPEQRQGMREISRGEGSKLKYLETNFNKKRKCASGERKSVQAAAQEFLDKAARELLGENNGGFKGPLQPMQSQDSEEK